MNIKRVFLDMDGTLLNSQGEVSLTNAELIRNAGLPVTLVSARAPMEMREAIKTLGLKGLQIGFNGGLIYQMIDAKVKPIRVQPLAQNEVQDLLTYIRKQFPTVSMSYYDLNNWYCDRIDEGIRYEHNLTHQQPTLSQMRLSFLNHPSIFLK